MKKQKDGRYRAKVTVGHDAEGHAIVKYAAGRTQKELLQNKEELKKRFINGAIEVERDVLFNDYALDWYESIKLSLKAGMKKGYASTLNQHILPVFENRQLRAITHKDLQELLNSKKGYKPTTIGNILYVIREIYQKAAIEGIIDRDPSVKLNKPPAKKDSRRELTELETAAVLRVSDSNEEGLLLLILYFTGVRIGEALGLQWGDVDFENADINIRRDIDFMDGGKIGDVKTQNSERTIPLPSPLLDALKKVRSIGNQFILSAPRSHSSLSQSTLKRRWNRLMRAVYLEAGNIIDEQKEQKAKGLLKTVDALPESKIMNPKAKKEHQVPMCAITPHYFRHNYASILYDEDVDVLSAKYFLGHSDVKTTLQIYSHLSKAKRAKKANSVRQAFDAIYKVAKKLPEVQKEALLQEVLGKEKS